MERIRSAIEKARAERQRNLEGQPLPLSAGQTVPHEEPANTPAIAKAPKPEPRPAVITQMPTPERTDQWMRLEGFQPKPALMKRNRIVSFEGGQNAVSFDVMRTRLLQQIRANGWKRVAITSPGSSCGKTTTCLNLAFSLARQPELHTMLVEMDMRRPSMAKTIGLRKQQMFAQVLAGTEVPEDHMVRYGTNLAIATNHRAAANPAELLMNSRIGDVLSDLEDRYDPDVMIFDMPPMLAGDDTLAFLGHVDCALLVVAAESTTIKEVDLCEQDIARQTNVLGVTMNKCRYLEEGQGYGYYAYKD